MTATIFRRWSLREEHRAAAARWNIDPQRDLLATH